MVGVNVGMCVCVQWVGIVPHFISPMLGIIYLYLCVHLHVYYDTKIVRIIMIYINSYMFSFFGELAFAI